jgi:hypothetical protein
MDECDPKTPCNRVAVNALAATTIAMTIGTQARPISLVIALLSSRPRDVVHGVENETVSARTRSVRGPQGTRRGSRAVTVGPSPETSAPPRNRQADRAGGAAVAVSVRSGCRRVRRKALCPATGGASTRLERASVGWRQLSADPTRCLRLQEARVSCATWQFRCERPPKEGHPHTLWAEEPEEAGE